MRIKYFTFTAIAALACMVSLAMAEEVTRETYKAQVEPICQANTKANEKILAGVRSEVKEGKLKLAGTQFAKAGAALKKAYNQIKAVPRPPADEAKLTKWLKYVQQEVKLFEEGARALKANNKTLTQRVVARLTSTANLANSQVSSFGFRYCKLNPSKFT
jgi:hypothetical protein